MFDDPLEAIADLGGELVDLGGLGRSFARCVECLAQLVDEVQRADGDVLDEVERVLDLVRDPCGELPEGGELLLVHHLVLGLAHIDERAFECVVLVREHLAGVLR